jgi:ferritin-like metal-binding protein YciE
MKTETFEDLFYLQLCELYDVEGRLVQALGKMARAASSGSLRECFTVHKEQTKTHLRRLEEIFRDIGRPRGSKAAEGIAGLVKEGENLIAEQDQSALRDAALIGAGNRVEHYEIASYGTAIAFAHLLGQTRAAELLEQTLEEEKAADARLTSIAEGMVNQEALHLGVHQHV